MFVDPARSSTAGATWRGPTPSPGRRPARRCCAACPRHAARWLLANAGRLHHRPSRRPQRKGLLLAVSGSSELCVAC